jgi:tRNA1Val (adenine37-N6)-methyltransferase
MTGGQVTRDALFGGALSVRQPRHGYRVNVDALLLAAFAARDHRARLAVDLGAGVGAIGLVLAHVGAAAHVVLVERDPELAQLARENLAENGCAGALEAHDLERQGLPRVLAQCAELVVSNPPFFPPATGTPSKRARAARSGEVLPFLRAASHALAGPRARAAFCYPSAALPELLARAEDAKLVAKRLRFVHARADAPARLALVELRLAKPGGLVVEPPLVEWQSGRARTPELVRIVRGEFGPNA